GQDEDLGRHDAPNLARGFQAIQLRHADIEDHDIGLEGDSLGHSVASGARLAAHDPSGLSFQDRAHTLPNDLMVVSDEGADSRNRLSLVNGRLALPVVPLSVNSI